MQQSDLTLPPGPNSKVFILPPGMLFRGSNVLFGGFLWYAPLTPTNCRKKPYDMSKWQKKRIRCRLNNAITNLSVLKSFGIQTKSLVSNDWFIPIQEQKIIDYAGTDYSKKYVYFRQKNLSVTPLNFMRHFTKTFKPVEWRKHNLHQCISSSVHDSCMYLIISLAIMEKP